MSNGTVFIPPDETDQLHRLLVILTDPAAYENKLAELKTLSEALKQKQDELDNEDARIEAAHKAATLDINAATLAMREQSAKEQELVRRETAVATREQAVANAEKSHRETSALCDDQLKARESDVTRREAAIKPKSDELAAREKDLDARHAVLAQREAKAREYARALGG